MSDQAAVRSAASTYAAFAVPISMIGVYWPEVQVEFGQRVGQLGLVSFVYGISRMSTAVAGRRLLQHMTMGSSFIVALVALAVSALAVSGSPTWTTFLIAVGMVGVVSGLLDSLGSIFITTIGNVSSAGLIHGMYGLGATVGPLIVAASPTWRWSALTAAVLVMGALTVAIRSRSSWPVPVATAPAPDVVVDPVRPLVLFASLGAFASLVALEVTTGQWGFTYLTASRSVSDSLAAIGVSGFWAGLMVGRLLISQPTINQMVERAGTIRLCLVALGALAGVALLPAVPAVGCLALTGLCLGPLVPTLFARTRQRVGEVHAARMAGRQLIATNIGAITIPAATGALVDTAGENVIILVSLAVLAGISLPLLAVLRRVAPV